MENILKQFSKNWKPKVISLFVGIAVFIYVQDLKMETMNISVPVTYESKPSKMLWSESPPRFIKITIRGKKEDLKFPTGNLSASVDLSGARKGAHRYPIYFDRAQIPEKVKVVSIAKHITIRFERTKTKDVIVKALFEGNVAKGYIHGRGSVTPQKIEIRGPASILNNIRQINTEKVNLKNAKANIKKVVNLIPPHKQVTLGQKSVEIEIAIYQENTTNEKIIGKIPIEVLNLDPALEVFLSNKTVKIHVRGNHETLQNISTATFVASINLEGTKYNPKTKNILPFDTESGIPVEVKSRITNEQVDILDITPDNLTVRFRIKPEFIAPEEKPPPAGGGEAPETTPEKDEETGTPD